MLLVFQETITHHCHCYHLNFHEKIIIVIIIVKLVICGIVIIIVLIINYFNVFASSSSLSVFITDSQNCNCTQVITFFSFVIVFIIIYEKARKILVLVLTSQKMVSDMSATVITLKITTLWSRRPNTIGVPKAATKICTCTEALLLSIVVLHYSALFITPVTVHFRTFY